MSRAAKRILANCNLCNFGSCNRCITKSILKIKEEWMMSQPGEKTLLHHVIRGKEQNLISMSTSLSPLILLASTQKWVLSPLRKSRFKGNLISLSLLLHCSLHSCLVPARPFHSVERPKREIHEKSPRFRPRVLVPTSQFVERERKSLVRNTRKAGMWRKASWAFYALVTEKSFIFFDPGLSLHATGRNWSTCFYRESFSPRLTSIRGCYTVWVLSCTLFQIPEEMHFSKFLVLWVNTGPDSASW